LRPKSDKDNFLASNIAQNPKSPLIWGFFEPEFPHFVIFLTQNPFARSNVITQQNPGHKEKILLISSISVAVALPSTHPAMCRHIVISTRLTPFKVTIFLSSFFPYLICTHIRTSVA
jgi:hypothetical protein